MYCVIRYTGVTPDFSDYGYIDTESNKKTVKFMNLIHHGSYIGIEHRWKVKSRVTVVVIVIPAYYTGGSNISTA